MATTQQRQRVAADDTAKEHRAIVQAILVLERALASPTPGRIEAWKTRARADFKKARDALKTHRDSSEKPGGILDELEIMLGRNVELTRVRSEHELITRQAEEIVDALDDPKTTGKQIRDMAAELTALARLHQAHEADLILSAFNRDIGVGD